MKGLVFTEFIEFVENNFGYETVDSIIERTDLQSEGIYTQAGQYPPEELVSMISELSKASGKSIQEILQRYGEHLFRKLLTIYHWVTDDTGNTLDFIAKVDSQIHIEVKKLYPNATLPKFTVLSYENGEMELFYRSEQKLEELAIGMMKGCAKHYNEVLEIKSEKISDDPHTVKFHLKVLSP